MDGELGQLETLRVEREGDVTIIVLNRPAQGNAWTLRMAHELEAAMRETDASDDVRAVVVTGAGATFSVGADLKAGTISRPGDDEDLAVPDRSLLPSQVRKPVIAAMNGHA